MDLRAGGIGAEVECGEDGEDGLEDGISGRVRDRGECAAGARDGTEIGRNAVYWPEQADGDYMYFS